MEWRILELRSESILSVVIPTRNRPKLLLRALASVAKQSRRDVEVVVVNDGCHDIQPPDTLGGSIPVSCVNLVNRRTRRGYGPAVARNAGIKATRTPWVAFLDDDDEWEPTFVEIMMSRLERERYAATFAWSSFLKIEYAPDGTVRHRQPRLFSGGPKKREQLFSDALSIGAGCGLTLRRSCLERIGGFRTKYSLLEDTDLLFRLLITGCHPVSVPDILVRIHLDDSLVRLTDVSRYPTRIAEFRALLLEFEEFLGKFPVIREWMWDYLETLIDRYRAWEVPGVDAGSES